MTKSLALAFAALALSAGAALASPAAAPVNNAANPALQRGIVSGPEIGNYGSRRLPVFNYGSGDPVTISTPYTLGNVGSQQLPVFNYRGGVAVNGSTGGFNTQNCAAQLFPSVTCFVNQTGGGH